MALFTDKSNEWRKKPRTEIEIRCLDDVYLIFRFKLIRLKAYEAEKYITTKNKFIAVLRSAMKWDLNNKIMLAVDFIRSYREIEENIKNVIKNIDIIEYFFYFDIKEKERLLELLRERSDTSMIVQEFIKEGERIGEKKGKIEGKLEGKLEGQLEGKIIAAKKLYQKGFSIKDIIDITELSKEDLIKNGVIES